MQHCAELEEQCASPQSRTSLFALLQSLTSPEQSEIAALSASRRYRQATRREGSTGLLSSPSGRSARCRKSSLRACAVRPTGPDPKGRGPGDGSCWLAPPCALQGRRRPGHACGGSSATRHRLVHKPRASCPTRSSREGSCTTQPVNTQGGSATEIDRAKGEPG